MSDITREQEIAYIEGANERREKAAAARLKDPRVQAYLHSFDHEFRERDAALAELTEIAQKNDMGY